jgi:hypothetical protein
MDFKPEIDSKQLRENIDAAESRLCLAIRRHESGGIIDVMRSAVRYYRSLYAEYVRTKTKGDEDRLNAALDKIDATRFEPGEISPEWIRRSSGH